MSANWRLAGRAAVALAARRMPRQADGDSGTLLPNRGAFQQRLTQALATADGRHGGVGLLLLDLDNFKLVNAALGHGSGDALLAMVTQRLAALLQPGQQLCRIGADEFAVIVAAAGTVASLVALAQRLLGALALPFVLERQQLHIGASVGLGHQPRDGGAAQALIGMADTALHQAKHQGKGRCVVFQPEMAARARRRLRLEANLRHALEHGGLTLRYQPQIALTSGRVVGMEVLLRWTCPELGVVDPGEFVTVAEESGVIIPLGRWVLQQACRQGAAWFGAGLLGPVRRMAVNLSAGQTRDAGLVEHIEALLAETALPACLLELEITETVLMENVHANLVLMQRLRDAGIALSVDDFGTGYSSMAYLNRLPIDKLKIDRSFVRNVPGDGEAIATAIIAMAHSLRLAVVAEGVETAQQATFLRGAGCDMAQGYYYAAPLTAADMTALLGERRVWPPASLAPTQAVPA